jgi:hypothetical protein
MESNHAADARGEKGESTVERNIKEIRTRVGDYFRKRRVPEPTNLTDEQARMVHERLVESSTRVARFTTRNARVRAAGPNTPQATPAKQITAEDERESNRRRAQEIIDEQEEIRRNRLLLSAL